MWSGAVGVGSAVGRRLGRAPGVSGRVLGCRVLGCRFGWWGCDGFAAGPVGAPERGVPGEVSGCGLVEAPAAGGLQCVVAGAEGAEVGVEGGAAVLVGDGVVLLGLVGGAAAAGEHAGAVADLDVAAQRGVGEASIGEGTQDADQLVAVGVLGGEVGDQWFPARWGRRGEAAQQVERDLQFDGSAGVLPGDLVGVAVRCRPAAGETGEQQVAVGVGDGEAPSGGVVVGDGGAGGLGWDGAPAGDLGRVVVEADEGGEPDPDLDAGAGLFGGLSRRCGLGRRRCGLGRRGVGWVGTAGWAVAPGWAAAAGRAVAAGRAAAAGRAVRAGGGAAAVGGRGRSARPGSVGAGWPVGVPGAVSVAGAGLVGAGRAVGVCRAGCP